jgi:maltose alpha-D-glucosyltransferase/alpha-amylase
VLFTGKDFVIIDFEGEPIRTLSERRLKRCPLYDVAGMLRSLQYAASASITQEVPTRGVIRVEDRSRLERAARAWSAWAGAVFLRGYRQVTLGGGFVPETQKEFMSLLNAFLIEKGAYELVYELNNRPNWISIPLTGLLEMLPGPPSSDGAPRGESSGPGPQHVPEGRATKESRA